MTKLNEQIMKPCKEFISEGENLSNNINKFDSLLHKFTPVKVCEPNMSESTILNTPMIKIKLTKFVNENWKFTLISNCKLLNLGVDNWYYCVDTGTTDVESAKFTALYNAYSMLKILSDNISDSTDIFLNYIFEGENTNDKN